MPTTSKTLFRGAATTNTATVLYTTPSSTTAVVTNIIITNTSATGQTFTLAFAGTNLATTVTVASYDSTVIDLKQVLTTTQTITGGASSVSVNFHISGVEIV